MLIVKMNCYVDYLKTWPISDNKRINIIILRQVIVGILELFIWLGVENVNFCEMLCKRAFLTKKIYEIIAINKDSLKTYNGLVQRKFI